MLNKNGRFKKYEYISFDIFDTLIKRNVSSPVEIFDVVEKKYNYDNSNKICNFKKNRIEAELEARKNKKEEEITIDDIYYRLGKKLDNNVCEELKRIEMEVEYSFSNPNKKISKFYNYCIKNKRVVITSDIYLPRNLIERILSKNGFNNYQKLYLSSEIKKTKASGNLYKYIKKDLGTQNILHIGDNIKSDFISAIKNGIEAKVIYKGCFEKRKKDNGIIETLINNNITGDYYYDFGLKNMGPLLLGFCYWLKNEKEKEHIEKLFFLSRDGNIMKKAYDSLYDDESYYLYASRRALIVPSLWKANNCKEMLSMMNIPKNIKIIHLLERLGISDANNQILDNYNLHLENSYKYVDLLNCKEFMNYLKDNYSQIISNSKNEYGKLQKYLDKNNFNGNLGIVDIGWFGSMQKALERLLSRDISGFYLGIHTRKKSQTPQMHGFIFENGKNIDLDNDEYLFNSILEFMFSTFHGSVKCFKENGEVELYDYEYDSMDEKEYLKKIQQGAIDFVEMAKSINLLNVADYTESESYKRLFKTCLFPSQKDCKMLGKICVLDNGINMIGTNKNTLYYFFHPISFYKDFRNSTWKIGFLKKVFIIPINYYKIIKCLKRWENR